MAAKAVLLQLLQSVFQVVEPEFSDILRFLSTFSGPILLGATHTRAQTNPNNVHIVHELGA